MTSALHHSPRAALALALALAAVACLPSPSAAQVIRCTDPATGKVSYTDAACPRGQAAHEVEARKTPQEIQQEREQAAEALERKHERQQWELQQRQSAESAPRPAPPAAPGDPAQSADCQRARKSLQEVVSTLGRGMYDEQTRLDAAQRQADLACLSPADYARAESARASRQPYSYPSYVPYSGYQQPYLVPPVARPPHRPRPQAQPQPEIANCNVFRCYDGKGNTYPRR